MLVIHCTICVGDIKVWIKNMTFIIWLAKYKSISHLWQNYLLLYLFG